MGLINNYIRRHHAKLTTREISRNLGLPIWSVRERIKSIKDELRQDDNIIIQCPHLEISALRNFIDVKKSGIWVDIAEKRIAQLLNEYNEENA